MNNITIDEVKDIFKCSIDETTNMNGAIERTLQHIYLKGRNDAEKEHSYHLKKIRAEIQENINYNKKMNYQGIVAGLLLTLDIIDKYRKEQTDAT